MLLDKKKNSAIEFLKFIAIWADYFLLCSLQPGFSWKSHGTLSRIFFNVLIYYIFLLKFLVKILKVTKILNNKNQSLLFTAVFCIVVFLLRIGYYHNYYNVGFNNESIHNEGEMCHFFKIGVSWYDAFGNFFIDFAHQNSDCSARKIDLDFLYKK